MIHEPIANLAVPVEGLKPYRGNPRRGNVELVAESLSTNGQYRPIVVRSSTREVLAGNHTLAAAKHLGWTEIAATFVDVDDEQAARIVLIDNRANDVAAYDEAELAAILQGLPDLVGTGYAAADLDALVYGLEQEPAESPDDVDELPEVLTIAQPGDLIHLGRHRVLCADSTDPASVAQVLGGGVADAMWTDPPYGVEYVGKTAAALTIANDGGDDLEQLLTDAWAAVLPGLKPGAPVYVAHSDTRRVTFETTMAAAGFLVRQNLIWAKSSMVLGRSDYHYQHEPILYGFAGRKPGRLGRGGPYWFGGHDKTTVLSFPKPAASREHPTMKPVDLILAMLANSTRPGHTILDPFAGSGSTLIAAELHGASAAVVELDPRFVDVICGRWQKLTGEKPTREGEALDFLAGDQ